MAEHAIIVKHTHNYFLNVTNGRKEAIENESEAGRQ